MDPGPFSVGVHILWHIGYGPRVQILWLGSIFYREYPMGSIFYDTGFPLCMLMASLIFLLSQFSSLSRIFTSLIEHWWPVLKVCGTLYVTGLENSCQLFRQLTNVGETYGMLSSVGFSGVDICYVSPWC